MFKSTIVSKLCILAIILSANNVIAQDLELLDSNVTASFRGINVVNKSEVWVSGSDGTVIRTLDSGTTWSKINVPNSEELDFRDIEVLDDGAIVLMSIGNGETSKLLRSKDAGTTWQVVLQNQDQQAFFDGMTFHADGKRGALFGDPIGGFLDLYLTEDAGLTWNRLPKNERPKVRIGEVGFAASGTGMTWTKSGLQIATGGSVARIHRTKDNGKRWETLSTTMLAGRSSAGIFSIDMLNDQIVIVGGDYLKPDETGVNVSVSSNGGRNFHVPGNNNLGHKACVKILDPTTFVACGRTGIDLSVDAGQTWKHLSDAAFYTMEADTDSQTVYLAGPKGAVAKLTLPNN